MANIPQAQPLFTARFVEDVTPYQNIVLYADSGAGKTFLAASALLVPEMCDVLFISLESGESALREVIRKAKALGIDPNRILVIPPQTFGQFAQVYEMLKIHIQARDRNDEGTLRQLEAQIRGFAPEFLRDAEVLREMIPKPLKFQTVIIDSLTEAQKFCMYQLLSIDPFKQKLDEEPDSAEFKDWGRSREMTGFLVRRFRDLPINAIFTCSEAVEQDAKKLFNYDVNLPGKLSTDVRSMVDTVGYLMTGQAADGGVMRRLILRSGTYGSSVIKAKNRYGSNLKQAWVDNPMMSDLYALGKE